MPNIKVNSIFSSIQNTLFIQELYIKNEYDQDTFSKKYNTLLDEVDFLNF